MTSAAIALVMYVTAGFSGAALVAMATISVSERGERGTTTADRERADA